MTSPRPSAQRPTRSPLLNLLGPVLFLLALLPVPSFPSIPPPGDDSAEDPLAVIEIDARILSDEDVCALIATDTLGEIQLHGNILEQGREVACRVRGRWFQFDPGYDPGTIRPSFVDIDLDGVPELVVRGSCANYGTGGGTTESGVTIFRLDSSVWQLFSAVDEVSDEMFGRAYNNWRSYTHTCSREIEIHSGHLRVMPVGGSSYRSLCDRLTQLRPGIYSLHGGAIVRTGDIRQGGKEGKKPHRAGTFR